MSTPKYSFDQVRRAVEKVVHAQPDHIYQRHEGCSPCRYITTVGADDCPDCVVGHAFKELGDEAWEALKDEEARMYPASFGIFEAEDYFPGFFDERTITYLTELQGYQDPGVNPWGKCLQGAERADQNYMNSRFADDPQSV